MRNCLSKIFLFMVILAVCGLTAFAQSTATGSLTGTVADPQGARVPGAAVTVKSNGTGQEFTA